MKQVYGFGIRKILINYYKIDEIVSELLKYKTAVDTIESTIKEVEIKLGENTGDAINSLIANGQTLITELEGIKTELTDLHTIFSEFHRDMYSYIAPEYNAMTTVDRNDIWHNLQQIDRQIIVYKGIYSNKPYREPSEAEPNELTNRSKLLSIVTETLPGCKPYLDSFVNELWDLYNKKIELFENKDDIYGDKAYALYKKYTDLGEKLYDIEQIRVAFHWDIIRGVANSLISLIKLIVSISIMVNGACVLAAYSMFDLAPPDWAIKQGDKLVSLLIGAGIAIHHPKLLIGAIGQSISETFEEEGIAYCVGAIAGEVVFDFITAGVFSAIKGGKYADNVVGAIDDIPTGSHIDDIMPSISDELATRITSAISNGDEVSVIKNSAGELFVKIGNEITAVTKTQADEIMALTKQIEIPIIAGVGEPLTSSLSDEMERKITLYLASDMEVSIIKNSAGELFVKVGDDIVSVTEAEANIIMGRTKQTEIPIVPGIEAKLSKEMKHKITLYIASDMEVSIIKNSAGELFVKIDDEIVSVTQAEANKIIAATGQVEIPTVAGVGEKLPDGVPDEVEPNVSGVVPPESIPKHTGDSIVFGSDAKSAEKLANQMEQRGWTEELVKETVDNPYTTRTSTNLANNNPATAYFNQDGSYVVIDDITKEVVQVSNALDPGWAPDSNIINPYIPE